MEEAGEGGEGAGGAAAHVGAEEPSHLLVLLPWEELEPQVYGLMSDRETSGREKTESLPVKYYYDSFYK